MEFKSFHPPIFTSAKNIRIFFSNARMTFYSSLDAFLFFLYFFKLSRSFCFFWSCTFLRSNKKSDVSTAFFVRIEDLSNLNLSYLYSVWFFSLNLCLKYKKFNHLPIFTFDKLYALLNLFKPLLTSTLLLGLRWWFYKT